MAIDLNNDDLYVDAYRIKIINKQPNLYVNIIDSEVKKSRTIVAAEKKLMLDKIKETVQALGWEIDKPERVIKSNNDVIIEFAPTDKAKPWGTVFSAIKEAFGATEEKGKRTPGSWIAKAAAAKRDDTRAKFAKDAAAHLPGATEADVLALIDQWEKFKKSEYRGTHGRG